MTSRSLTVMVGAALAVAACDTFPELGMGGRPAAPTPVAAHAYVALAASSDLFEVQSAQLALQRSQDQRHRTFAEMIIRDHRVMTTQLAAAASAAGLGLPPQMDGRHMRMLDELSRAPNFDAVYHRQQIEAHEMALALHRNYAARGDRPELRGYASLTAPVIQRHLDQIRGMM